MKGLKDKVLDVLHLMLRALIVIWIWTGGLALLALCYAYFKTKEFIQIRVLKRE